MHRALGGRPPAADWHNSHDRARATCRPHLANLPVLMLNMIWDHQTLILPYTLSMQQSCPAVGRAGLLLVAREPAAHARLVRVWHARGLRRQARQARRHARLRAVQLPNVATRVRRPLARARQRGRQRGQRRGQRRQRARAIGAGGQARRVRGLEGGRGRLEAGGRGRRRERGRGRCLPRRVVPLRACACQGAVSAQLPDRVRQGGMRRETNTNTQRAAVQHSTPKLQCQQAHRSKKTARRLANRGGRPHLHACICTRNRRAAAKPGERGPHLNPKPKPPSKGGGGTHSRAGWRPSRP